MRYLAYFACLWAKNNAYRFAFREPMGVALLVLLLFGVFPLQVRVDGTNEVFYTFDQLLRVFDESNVQKAELYTIP